MIWRDFYPSLILRDHQLKVADDDTGAAFLGMGSAFWREAGGLALGPQG